MHSTLERLNRMVEESRRFRETFPEIASAWDEAIEEEESRRKARQEAAEVARRREDVPRRLRVAGAPERCVAAWEGGLRETPAVSAVKTLAKSDKCLLLLSGGPGTGKTIAGVSILAERFLRPCGILTGGTAGAGLFVRASEASRLGLYGDEARKLTEQMLGTDVLVLDDLGAEMLSDPWRALLDELVDTRYGDTLVTVITTNLDAESFRSRYGERIADRFRQDGMVATCGAESMRRAEAVARHARRDGRAQATGEVES